MKFTKPIPTEYEEQCKFVQYLEILKKKGAIKRFTAIPNSTYTKSWSQKHKNKASGLRSGLPDLFILTPNGSLFIEMKRTKGGTTSATQKEWIKDLNDSGIPTKVCKGYDEAVEFLNEIINNAKES